ncbi:MAG: ATP-binding protein, partial [Geminicoccaceae bacterium]
AQAEIIVGIQVDALAIPIWNFDRDEIQRQLDLFVAHPDIISASVIPNSGLDFMPVSANALHHGIDYGENRFVFSDVTGSAEAGAPGSSIDDSSGIDNGGSGILEHEIGYAGEMLGRMVVTYSRERTAKIRNSVIVAQLRQFVIITAVIALTITLAVSGLVRPILNITEAMATIAEGDVDLAIPAADRRDEIGKMARALKVFKTNAVELKRSLDKERELSGLQRQFVSMVSHEFRTPLAIIDGNAQRIIRRSATLSPAQLQGSQKKVRLAVARLTELMETVLSSAHLEEGRIAFEPGDFRLTDMLVELCNNYRELNEELQIILDIDSLPDRILADGRLLRQVFSNLLSNAIKYSNGDGRVWLSGYRDDRDRIVISVRDEGVGIPLIEQANLFKRFFRASTSIGVAGTGIGLNLVYHFVNLHDGQIDVESEAGMGTTFVVNLPFIDPPREATAKAA